MGKFSFTDTVKKLRSTPRGKEASMYGPIRDIFIQSLGYAASDVDIDTTGESGRPDVTVRAPAGFEAENGKPATIDWIVVEAKHELGSFADPARRERIFAEKAKYIGPYTAWFVMVEPDLWILRPIGGGESSAAADIEIAFNEDLTEDAFKHLALGLGIEMAGAERLLLRFRDGDTTLIATDRLQSQGKAPNDREVNRVTLARRHFFAQVREATRHLQAAVNVAYSLSEAQVAKYRAAADAFWERFGRADNPFEPHTLTLRGRPSGPEQTREHRREVARLRKWFSQSPDIARLAVAGLPSFQSRTGASAGKLKPLFVIETANLILARVLLLRFFEDHGFFGDKRYVCNGGVAAFQGIQAYFESSYARLLEQAYAEGSRLYAAAFDATELDWIFGSDDKTLSRAIEYTLFRFARYDFTTIKGDILTGIYDRFMDRDQRKRLGEFYTPPSIARYMVRHAGVTRESRVFDPACGSGTFLIEAYREMVGDDVARGAADFEDVEQVFGRLAGNDLNTFSSVLTQIQLLWQVLEFKRDIEARGFPDAFVTGKVNSLVERDQWSNLDAFAEIDGRYYDVVIGNPPYVRAERSAQALDPHSAEAFERGTEGFQGVSGKLNQFALFLYRALDRWARPESAEAPAGRVAFIMPVSLFDANTFRGLRDLFRLGGRWTVREIVDLEVIYRKVFDADVLPAIVIAENRAPRESDRVSIRLADPACVKPQAGHHLPDFDLDGLTETKILYRDLFSPDGRILSRMTPERLDVLHKLWKLDTLQTAAKPYWVLKRGARIEQWTDREPGDLNQWEARRMVAGGVAFRGSKNSAAGGIDIYKGENIVAAELQGAPALKSADLSQVDDASLWKYRDILPSRGIAVARVAHCPNAVRFDPAKQAFTNTATLLFPRDDLIQVPFDLILLSNVYVWFYALAARMGILRTLRSDVYPTNLALLPWSQALAARAGEIEGLREEVITACTKRMATAATQARTLAALGLRNLKRHLIADPEARLDFGARWTDSVGGVTIESVTLNQTGDMWRVSLSNDLFDWIECNREPIARGLALALQQRLGEEIDRSAIRKLPVPVTQQEQLDWERTLANYADAAVGAAMENALTKLDLIVGNCLGLSRNDVSFIQADLRNDPFLRGIRPRYPGTVTRKQGFRKGLDSQNRYE